MQTGLDGNHDESQEAPSSDASAAAPHQCPKANAKIETEVNASTQPIGPEGELTKELADVFVQQEPRG